MPIVRCAPVGGARRLVPATAILVGLALLPTACSDNQPTGPRAGNQPMHTSEASGAGLIRDDFTDADGTLLQDHTPDGGSEPFSWLPAASWGVS